MRAKRPRAPRRDRSRPTAWLAAAVVCLGVALAAHAQEETTILVTPPLQLGNPSLETAEVADYGVECIATNVSFTTARRITIQIFDGQGIPTAPPASPTPTPGPTPTPIPPLQAAIRDDPGYEDPGSTAAGVRYCVITVEGSADDVRTSFCLRDYPVGRCTVAVVASERTPD